MNPLNPLAIKQGRLSAPPIGRTQALPWTGWEAEFDSAQSLGLAGIEWQLSPDQVWENPILNNEGRRSIAKRIAATGVGVPSVCADYFIACPFFRSSEAERRQSIEVLEELIAAAADVGAGTVLIPVLQDAEIRNDEEANLLLDALEQPLSTAARLGVALGLETELPADRYLGLVTRRPHPQLGVYYDVGNAVFRGFDPASDLCRLAPHLVGVHLKDRKRGGESVPFGEGDVDFAVVFAVLAEIAYRGPFVLEPKSGADFLGLARHNVGVVRANRAPAG